MSTDFHQNCNAGFIYKTAYTYLHKLHYKSNILSLILLPVTDLLASKTSTKMISLAGGHNLLIALFILKAFVVNIHIRTPIHAHRKQKHVM